MAAIVVGEYERAFTGTQFAAIYTRCTPGAVSSCGCPKQEARSISPTAITER